MSAPGPPPLPAIPYPAWLKGGGSKGADEKPPGGPGDKPAPATGGGGATYTLPPEVKAGLDKAWKDSFPGGQSQEQGGILVRKADGSLEWRAGKPKAIAEGGSGAFSPNYGDVKAGETLAATAHTHPYSKAEGGFTNVSFSGGDLANMAISPREPMKFVRSGDGVFMTRTTPEFEKELTAKGEAKLAEEMRKTYKEAFDKFPGGTVDSAHAATKAVCEKYHLEYFKGTGGTLTQVDTSK